MNNETAHDEAVILARIAFMEVQEKLLECRKQELDFVRQHLAPRLAKFRRERSELVARMYPLLRD